MNDTKKLHETLDLLGMRAQAAAIGMIQIAVELGRAGVLEEAAIGRIKDAIFGEIALRRPTSVPKDEYDRTMRRRLDALFAGQEKIGNKPPAEVAAVIDHD
jgi:hypothetical protein